VAWLPGARNTPFLRLIKCIVPDFLAQRRALRRQRSHVGIGYRGDLKEGAFSAPPYRGSQSPWPDQLSFVSHLCSYREATGQCWLLFSSGFARSGVI
jgi:hypothetical protein